MHDSHLTFWWLKDILSCVTKLISKVDVSVKLLQNDILQLFGAELTSLKNHNYLDFSNS